MQALSDLIAPATLLTTVGLWFYTWLREGRLRRWALEDAAKKAKADEEAAVKIAKELRESTVALAEKANDDAVALAAKVNADAISLAAKNLADATSVAQKVLDAAEAIAAKGHESAAKLAAISTEAAKKGEEAFSEANTVNAKIANLQEQIVKIGEHIEQRNLDAAAAEKAARETADFNVKVKAAIDEKLAEMNGHAPRKLRKSK